MAEYIKRDEFIAWLKRIPLKDLSEGRGLCRIIMEEDFKRAIRELPREVIADVAPVVRCCDCKYHYDCGTHFCDRLGMDCPDDSEFFCKYGARMDGDTK